MIFITLPQSGSIIDLDSVSFVIKIQSKTGHRGIRIGLGHSELQILPRRCPALSRGTKRVKAGQRGEPSKVDSTDADEHTPSRGATATGDKSAARISRNLNTETKT